MDPWAFPQCRRPRVVNRKTSLLKIQSSASIGAPIRSPSPLSSNSTLTSNRPMNVISISQGPGSGRRTCSLKEATTDVRKGLFFFRWVERLGTVRWFRNTFFRESSYIDTCTFRNIDSVAHKKREGFMGRRPKEVRYFADDCIFSLLRAFLPSWPRSLHSRLFRINRRHCELR